MHHKSKYVYLCVVNLTITLKFLKMYDLPEFQQAAILAINTHTNFTVFEPTEYAEKQGYQQVILPLAEGRIKWEEYKRDGLDELFYFFEETT